MAQTRSQTQTRSQNQKESNTVAAIMILDMRRRDRRFRSICSQLVLMNNDIRAIRRRYERSIKSKQHSFRYSQRLRLVTLEGVRNMFTDFAHSEADKLDAMEEVLLEEHDIAWQDVSEEQ